jgi:hypothetical protein
LDSVKNATFAGFSINGGKKVKYCPFLLNLDIIVKRQKFPANVVALYVGVVKVIGARQDGVTVISTAVGYKSVVALRRVVDGSLPTEAESLAWVR